MNQRRLWTSLIGIVVAVVAALAVNLATGNTPILGLDLQGGVSVILSPTDEATSDDLLVIRDLVRDELERTGIAEPDVRVEGSNLVVDLPGVKDQQEALDAVDVAGIVTLRPVIACAAPPPDGSSTSVPGSGVTSVPGSGATSVPGSGATSVPGSGATSVPGSGATSVPGSGATSVPGTRGTTGATTPAASTTPGPAGESRPRTAPPGDDTATTAAGTTSPATAPETTTPDGTSAPDSAPPTSAETGATTVPLVPPTTVQDGEPSAEGEILPTTDGGACQVGPPGGTGEVFVRNSAQANLIEGGWGVQVDLSGSGQANWNALAAECYSGTATCPSRQLAIVLDDIIQSAPTVNEPNFPGGVSITGSFEESEARSLSRVLNRGAFPVTVEAQSVETVSPTLGTDSLRAAIVAGLIGVVLVLLYMLLFYRSLTVLVLAGMTVWGMLVYSVSAIISQTTNYALTLAGVTGIIISVGVTVDSYVVYFERLKDEARHGRTLKNSSERAFKATWRTIVSADLVAIIGASVLFVLSVGSVRGFALYLGITTACDLLVCYFFTRPSVILLAQTGRLDRSDPFGLKALT